MIPGAEFFVVRENEELVAVPIPVGVCLCCNKDATGYYCDDCSPNQFCSRCDKCAACCRCPEWMCHCGIMKPGFKAFCRLCWYDCDGNEIPPIVVINAMEGQDQAA